MGSGYERDKRFGKFVGFFSIPYFDRVGVFSPVANG
jgi:hypothetical protein